LLYRILADFVVLTHLAFIAFALFGGLFALRWPRVTRVHVPAALWAAVVAFFGWLCPLTPIENALRRAAGSAEYSVGFIERYIVPVIYPAELTRELQVFLGFVVLVVNSTIYLVVWRRLRVERIRDSLNG
jgi:hypothetical protein